MMIFYKPGEGVNVVIPIVVLDYTRSDDNYSKAQIIKYAYSLGNEAAKGKYIDVLQMQIFSLDYSFTYTHSGIAYGNALKTKFQATITNAPMELIQLLNVKFIIGQENLESLNNAAKTIIDPEVFFPTGGFVITPDSGSFFPDRIKRTFMVYATPYNFDPRRVNSFLTIKGASFDSMVMRLQFAVDLSSTKAPLVTQLQQIFGEEWIIQYDQSLETVNPVVSRYYPPGTVNKIMSEICRDNAIAYDINSDAKTIYLKSLKSSDAKKTEFDGRSLTFGNTVNGSYLISTMSLHDYATCLVEAEAFDVNLFESVSVWDDSGCEDQFYNLRKMEERKEGLTGYRFYVLEYTYNDSRHKTSISFRGTNNWLLTQFKLETFMENKVYTQGGAVGG